MSESVREQVQALGNEIRDFKAQLKSKGLTAKEVNNHPDVQAKVAELGTLKAHLEKGDSLTQEAFEMRKKQEQDERERIKKAQIDKERQMLRSVEKSIEMPPVQRKIFHLFQSAGSGSSFHYEPPARLNGNQTGFGVGNIANPPVFVTEKWDGTTMQATRQAIFRRIDMQLHGKKQPTNSSQRYELRLVAWFDENQWMGLDFLEVDVRVVEAVKPHLQTIRSLDEGLCVYFECVHQRINANFKHLEGFAGVRVFDFARVGSSGHWDSGSFLPFDETIVFSSRFGLPCVAWKRHDKLIASELWAELEEAVNRQYDTVDAPLEGFVIREVSGDRIAKARVDHLQYNRTSEFTTGIETLHLLDHVAKSEVSVWEARKKHVEHLIPCVCALASFMLVLTGLRKFCSFQKPVQRLHEPHGVDYTVSGSFFLAKIIKRLHEPGPLMHVQI